MEQKSIDLQQKTLQTTYELNRLKKSYALDEEEFNMGVKSKAQLEVARDEFDYKTRSTALQLEGLRHDSAATILRRELILNGNVKSSNVPGNAWRTWLFVLLSPDNSAL